MTERNMIILREKFYANADYNKMALLAGAEESAKTVNSKYNTKNIFKKIGNYFEKNKELDKIHDISVSNQKKGGDSYIADNGERLIKRRGQMISEGRKSMNKGMNMKKTNNKGYSTGHENIANRDLLQANQYGGSKEARLKRLNEQRAERLNKAGKTEVSPLTLGSTQTKTNTNPVTTTQPKVNLNSASPTTSNTPAVTSQPKVEVKTNPTPKTNSTTTSNVPAVTTSTTTPQPKTKPIKKNNISSWMGQKKGNVLLGAGLTAGVAAGVGYGGYRLYKKFKENKQQKEQQTA